MDSLYIRSGINGLMGPTIPVSGVSDRPTKPGPNQIPATNAIQPDKTMSLSSKFSSFNYPFKSLFSRNLKQRRAHNGTAVDDAVLTEERESEGGQNGNWVVKILHVRSLWEGQDGNFNASTSSSSSCDDDVDDGGCGVMYDGDDDDDEKSGGEIIDGEEFRKMLKKVSLSEAKLYAQLSYLGNLAYDIPNIKPGNLLRRYRLRYITSSREKRELLAEAEKKELPSVNGGNENEEGCQGETEAKGDDEERNVRSSAAYQIAANAASYLHSRTRAVLPLRSSKDEKDHERLASDSGSVRSRDVNSKMASLMATTDSVTAVVAAKEEVKQAVADDLNSISSSPCEWFVCDDEKSTTRFFVIQGSETLASWQANLLFEPMQFEGLDVFVHRGIYEAAKGMYQQMLPEVQSYMKTHGSHAKFRFTGHSLGGSLSMLINLMLLLRGEVPYASLLPVVTFGSPCVMCGGDKLLRTLELPKSHVQAIVMHRDIVPRAFSCNYPRPAAELLKAVNGSFRNHPCLNSQKLLYGPMGELLILQPDSKFSPQHDLLPSGSGLYLLMRKGADSREAEKQLRAAKNAFLNSPHPLEILSDRSAYGSGGTIQRDHDMNSYLKCVRGVIRHELSRVRKAERERERLRKVWWPLMKPRVVETGIVVGTTTLAPTTGGPAQFNFSGALRTGRESVKRFSRLVASQHMHLLVVLLFPAKLLLIGAYSIIPR